MAGKYFWIKERHNPQLGVYFVAMGQITTKDARNYETRSSYGDNYMHRFTSKEVYEKRLAELKAKGERVQSIG
mgnify:FL=1